MRKVILDLPLLLLLPSILVVGQSDPGSGDPESRDNVTNPPISSILTSPAAAPIPNPVHTLDSIHPNNLRHHHHPRGPHFEENPLNITVREGGVSTLDCKVGLIEDKLVTWFRRKSTQLDLLTLGTKTHSSDPRMSLDFKYPNNWRLLIKNTSRNDSGVYICQISTHPPKVLEVQLNVDAPDVFIVNSRNEKIQDVHYKEGSTLQLTCSVKNIKSKIVNWFRDTDLLNQDISRGGISIKTEIISESSSAKSILRVNQVKRKDSGIYLCSAPPHNTSVSVHVLNAGENPAELYHNQAPARTSNLGPIFILGIIQIISMSR